MQLACGDKPVIIEDGEKFVQDTPVDEVEVQVRCLEARQ